MHHHSVQEMLDLVSQAEEMLEEHHVVACSRNMGVRERFVMELVRHLHVMQDAQVIVLSGSSMYDLDGFCRQLDRALPASNGDRLRRTIDGKGGVCERLKDRPSIASSHIKYRYYIWRDADALYKHNKTLFAKLVDAVAGVAAAEEYASEDLLLLHRMVLVGGSALHLCYDDARGPLRTWLPEQGHGSKPLWAVVTGIEKPPMKLLELA